MSSAVDLTTALSTLAQVSATLAALIGFLGLWKLDWYRREIDHTETALRQLRAASTGRGHLDTMGLINEPFETVIIPECERIASMPYEKLPKHEEQRVQQPIKAALEQWKTLPVEQQWLTWALAVFLLLALLTLGAALGGLVYAPALRDSTWGPRAIVAGSLMLVMGTVYMVAEAGGWLRTYRRVALVLTGVLGAVLVVWVLTGLFGAVAQVPLVEES